MYKASANGQQFLSRTAMHSTKGSRKGFDLLGHGENPVNVLTPEQKRDSLKAALVALNARRKLVLKNSPEWQQIGKDISAACLEIHQLRPKLKGGGVVVDHFISVCRERLPKPVFEAIMMESCKRAGRHLLFVTADNGGDILTVNEQRA